jgi:glycosyltransferase involved in cell wall biosynthesis
MISIIIPTYNRVNETECAVKSVLNQTYQDFEILVADDGSTDTTSEVFSYYPDPRVKYIRVDHSGLPAVPRNAALKQARGEWVAFLDSDDEWLPNKLESQLKILDLSPEIGLICSNAYVNNGTENSDNLFHSKDTTQNVWTFPDLLAQNIIITSSVLVKKALIHNSGGFLEDTAYRAIEDYALWLSISLQSNIYYLQDPLLIYTDMGNSIRNEQSSDHYWMGMVMISDFLLNNFSDYLHPYKSINRNFRSSCLKNLITWYEEKKEKKSLFKTCFKLLLNQPLHFRNYRFVLYNIIQICK